MKIQHTSSSTSERLRRGIGEKLQNRVQEGHWLSRNIFQLLVQKRMWKAEKRNVHIDDEVIIADSNAVRGKWCIELIIQVYPGSDGRVRNVHES